MPLSWALTIAKLDVSMTIRRLKRIRDQSKAVLKYVLESSWEACQGADGILAGYLSVAAQHIAERLGVPYFCAPIYAVGRTSEFPYFLAPFGLHAGPVYNRLSHVIAEQIFWELQREVVDGWRRRLGLPSLGHRTPYNYGRNPRNPVLYGLSTALLARPAAWAPHMDLVGFWFLDEYCDWKPPATILDFLKERDDAPISIGFGSLDQFGRSDLMNLVTAALRQTNLRGILIADGFTEDACRLSDRLYVLKSVPHGWLFPKVRAVVHHGGVGTVAAGLRAGRPTVTIPECSDQYFWGKRIAEYGAGPPPIPRSSLNTQQLANAIRTATTDARIEAAARQLSHIISTENGVQKVVDRVRSVCPL